MKPQLNVKMTVEHGDYFRVARRSEVIRFLKLHSMSPERCIAHYRITAKIGRGGIGEVYRATDAKLGRDVAVKILPDGFASDRDRLTLYPRGTVARVVESSQHRGNSWR